MALPEDYIDWKEQITSAMSNTDSISWFALVDPCADSRLPAILWELDDNPGIIPLFMNTIIHEVSMNGPLFVPLRKSSPLTEWILAESEEVPLGCFYAVQADEADVLFEHLQNLLECSLPSGKPGIFRFFDPRVMFAVAHYPNPVWMRYVAGQAISVYAWEPGCRKPVYFSEKGVVLEKEGIPVEQGLLDAISEHTSPYAVITSMRGNNGDVLRAMPLPQAYSFVKGICDSIASMHIPYLNDFIAGTAIAMQLNNNIFEDEYIRKVVSAKNEDQTLVDALQMVPD